METLSLLNIIKFPLKIRKEYGFNDFMTFDLYLGQVKGQRKISYKKCLGHGAKYHGRNELCPSLHGISQFVHSFVHF